MRWILLFLLIPGTFFYLNAQKALIKGRVVEEKSNEGLFGVNVIVRNSSVGATTDDNGNYELSVEPGKYIIEYSFIGLENQEREVGLQSGEEIFINITLSERVEEMDVFVVTGSKYKKRLDEEIVSMEVLKAESINNSNFKIEDALNRVPGINIIGESPSIRGGNGFAAGAASRVVFLLDGIPILRPDNGEIFYEILPLENIQQVEIIKGASSALYGSAAMNGIVNVITANPRNEPVTKLLVNYGFYQKYRDKDYTRWWESKVRAFGEGSIVHMKKFKDFDISLGANYWQDRSYLQSTERKRARANVKFRYFPRNIKNLTVGLNTNMLHQSGGTFFIWAGLDSSILVPQQEGRDISRTFNFDPYLTYFDKKDNQHSLKTRIFDIYNENTDGAEANTNQYLAEYSFLKQYKSGWNISTGTMGSYTITESATFGNHEASNLATYFQIDKNLFERWTITGGLRLEYFAVDTNETVNEIKLIKKDDGTHPTIPVKPVIRVGTNVRIFNNTFFRTSYGQAYRFPTIAELFVKTQRSGAYTYPSPKIIPETGWSTEIGIKQGFRVSDWIAYIDVSGFIIRYHDMIEFTFGKWGKSSDPLGGFGFKAKNVGNVKITGFEISSFGQGNIFGLPIDYLVGYTYLDPRNLDYNPGEETTSDNNPLLKYRIKHSAKANFDLTYKHFIVGLNGFYNSFMENVDEYIALIPGVVTYRKENFGGDFVLDAKIGYELSDEVRLSLIVKNVFNEDYTLRPAYLEPPRNYTFQLVYHLQ